MRFLKYTVLLLLLTLTAWGRTGSALDSIQEQGVLRVGTTGDYPPFTLLSDGRYEGFDIDLARLIGQELEVEVRFVPTTWNDVVPQLQKGEFDLAAGGITRTLARQRLVAFTDATCRIGKCPLTRRRDSDRFRSLADIDQHGVKVAVNPGGTNERYARQNLHHATIVMVEDNLKVPELIASGAVDVMLTDNVEALRAARLNPELAAVSAHRPWTTESLGLAVSRDDQAWINWLNLFLEEKERDGTLDRLRQKHGLAQRSPVPQET